MTTNRLMSAPMLLTSSIVATVMTLSTGTSTTDSSYRVYHPTNSSGLIVASNAAQAVVATHTDTEEQSRMYRGYSSDVRVPMGIALVMGTASTIIALLSLMPSLQSIWVGSLASLCGATVFGLIAAGRARHERDRTHVV